MKRKDLYKTEGKNGKVFISALIITGILFAGIALWSGGFFRKNAPKKITETGYEETGLKWKESHEPEENNKSEAGYKRETENASKTETIIALYRDIYKEAVKYPAEIRANTTDSLEETKALIRRLGEYGYTAVDRENQVNMTNPQAVMKFCESAEEGQKAELMLLVLSPFADLTIYQCKTENGTIMIVREDYQWKDESIRQISKISYPADFWEYTAEGYLLFGGTYDSDLNYVLELSEGQDCAALRVLPLDEKCREYGRTYLRSIGYRKNNLFLTDWSEEDFGGLNFYDVFDSLYQIRYEQPVPYEADENLNIKAEYRIPAQEFEAVIMPYFSIDKEELQRRTMYIPEEGVYVYRPRGFYESESPDIPCPEVTGYLENADGTITLLVNAVYPEEYTAKAFSHKTVIRPLPEGGFQYVSNEMLPSGQEPDLWWHSKRLTKEEWENL